MKSFKPYVIFFCLHFCSRMSWSSEYQNENAQHKKREKKSCVLFHLLDVFSINYFPWFMWDCITWQPLQKEQVKQINNDAKKSFSLSLRCISQVLFVTFTQHLMRVFLRVIHDKIRHAMEKKSWQQKGIKVEKVSHLSLAWA